jgi:hypothetical protein
MHSVPRLRQLKGCAKSEKPRAIEGRPNFSVPTVKQRSTQLGNAALSIKQS